MIHPVIPVKFVNKCFKKLTVQENRLISWIAWIVFVFWLFVFPFFLLWAYRCGQTGVRTKLDIYVFFPYNFQDYRVLYNNTLCRLYESVGILLTCGKHFHDRIVSLIGGGLDPLIRLTTQLVIEVIITSRESER